MNRQGRLTPEEADRLRNAARWFEEDVAARLGELRDLLNELVSEATDYQGDRSERWQASDVGQLYIAWADGLETLSGQIGDLLDRDDGIAPELRRLADGPTEE